MNSIHWIHLGPDKSTRSYCLEHAKILSTNFERALGDWSEDDLRAAHEDLEKIFVVLAIKQTSKHLMVFFALESSNFYVRAFNGEIFPESIKNSPAATEAPGYHAWVSYMDIMLGYQAWVSCLSIRSWNQPEQTDSFSNNKQRWPNQAYASIWFWWYSFSHLHLSFYHLKANMLLWSKNADLVQKQTQLVVKAVCEGLPMVCTADSVVFVMLSKFIL